MSENLLTIAEDQAKTAAQAIESHNPLDLSMAILHICNAANERELSSGQKLNSGQKVALLARFSAVVVEQLADRATRLQRAYEAMGYDSATAVILAHMQAVDSHTSEAMRLLPGGDILRAACVAIETEARTVRDEVSHRHDRATGRQRKRASA